MGERAFYSREFPVVGERRRYLLDDIPAGFWVNVRAKAKREGTSIRALILGLLKEWLGRE
jgi:hypothetical protein